MKSAWLAGATHAPLFQSHARRREDIAGIEWSCLAPAGTWGRPARREVSTGCHDGTAFERTLHSW